MKKFKLVPVYLLVFAVALCDARAESYRTDINPALLYYQAFILNSQAFDLNRNSSQFDYLTTNQWRGKVLPEEFGTAVAGYDNQFALVRHAAHATVPCDWGIDMSPGPETLLPHLAKCKGLAVAGRFRVMWDLQNGKPDDARDDLVASFVLGHNTARDGTLIATLVQIAIEAIDCSTIAENFGRFSPETLKQLMDGFDAAPARTSVAAPIAFEKLYFHDWLVNRIQDLRKQYPGNDGAVITNVQSILFMAGDAEASTNIMRVAAATGGTSEGWLRLLAEMDPWYTRIMTIIVLPAGQFEPQMKQFQTEVKNSPNPFVNLLFPSLEKCRMKEFRILIQLAMVHAAVEYRLRGEEGLKSVTDPVMGGSFEFERFKYAGVDRGFKLKSSYDGAGYPLVQIFVEKDGAAFNTDGPKAGQASTPPQ